MKRIFDVLEQKVSVHQKEDALAWKEFGMFHKLPAQTFLDQIYATAEGLIRSGLELGDKVAIISGNRPEWIVVDFAIQIAGGISVPIYPTITTDDYKYIFNDSGTKFVFVSNQEIYQKVHKAALTLDQIENIYMFDANEQVLNWKTLHAENANADIRNEIEKRKSGIETDHLMTIIYTSGTTGFPKGVMLSHANILCSVDGACEVFNLNETKRVLSFLPLCHIFERVAIFVYLTTGSSIYFAESIDTLAADLQTVKPHMFTTVPRMLEKLYDKIISKAYELSFVKKNLFFWALNLAKGYDPLKSMSWWKDTQLKIANKLIFSKWREALGGNIDYVICGSAALQPRLVRIFTAAGIPIMEGYGMTETSPGISINELHDIRVGTVGKILKGVQVKIAEDGEILVKGPNVMMGYYNKPEATAETITADGWLHTGDIGELVDQQYVKITDRKKEIFKTSGGKYIAPQVIENKLKESHLIDQAMVIGENRKFPAAFIVVSEAALIESQTEKGEPQISGKLHKIIEQIIDTKNQELAQYEKIKKFAIFTMPWGIDTGELTPTLKLKRKKILEKYASIEESLYA